MTRSAQIAAAIQYNLVPMTENTRAILDSGQAVTGEMLHDLYISSLDDAFNLALHGADKDAIKDYFSRVVEVDVKPAEGEDFMQSLAAWMKLDLSRSIFEAIGVNAGLVRYQGNDKIEPLDLDQLPTGPVISVMGRVIRDSPEDPIEPEIQEVVNACNKYAQMLPLLKQATSNLVLENAENGTALDAALETWSKADGILTRFEKSDSNPVLTDDVFALIIEKNKSLAKGTQMIDTVARTLKASSDEKRLQIAASVLKAVDGFDPAGGYAQSGLKLFIALQKTYLSTDNGKHRAQALNLMDAFHEKYFTTPTAKAVLATMYGDGWAPATVPVLTNDIVKAMENGASPKVLYDALSRTHKLNPANDPATNPSGVLPTTSLEVAVKMSPGYDSLVAVALSHYLGKDASNHSRVQNTITDTWQDEILAKARAIQLTNESKLDAGLTL
jgi:hypothetical protein